MSEEKRSLSLSLSLSEKGLGERILWFWKDFYHDIGIQEP